MNVDEVGWTRKGTAGPQWGETLHSARLPRRFLEIERERFREGWIMLLNLKENRPQARLLSGQPNHRPRKIGETNSSRPNPNRAGLLTQPNGGTRENTEGEQTKKVHRGPQKKQSLNFYGPRKGGGGIFMWKTRGYRLGVRY